MPFGEDATEQGFWGVRQLFEEHFLRNSVLQVNLQLGRLRAKAACLEQGAALGEAVSADLGLGQREDAGLQWEEHWVCSQAS